MGWACVAGVAERKMRPVAELVARQLAVNTRGRLTATTPTTATMTTRRHSTAAVSIGEAVSAGLQMTLVGLIVDTSHSLDYLAPPRPPVAKALREVATRAPRALRAVTSVPVVDRDVDAYLGLKTLATAQVRHCPLFLIPRAGAEPGRDGGA